MTCGGLMNLVAYGAQDVYLTGNPTITYFKVVYRRHTNFARESIEQFFNSAVDFGRKGMVDVSRNGDLITDAVVKIVLPEVKYKGQYSDFGHVQFAWVRHIGHSIMDEVELEIGGSTIDKQYGDWLHMWHQLSTSSDKAQGLARLLGDVPELTSVSSLNWNDKNNTLKQSYPLYIPLQFYFNRNNGLALPLIALQYHHVKIYVKLRPVDQLYIASEAFKNSNNNLRINEASIYLTYIFLDTEERRRFAQATHEYLVEQLQHTGDENAGTGATGKYKMTFNHPVKALYWVTKLGNYQGKKFLVYDHEDWNRALEKAAKLLLLAQFDLDKFGFFNEIDMDNTSPSYFSENNIEYDIVNPADPEQEPTYVFNDNNTFSRFSNGSFIGRLSCKLPLLARGKEDLRNKIDGVIRIATDFDNQGMIYPVVDRITRNDLTISDLSIPIEKFEADNRVQYSKNHDLFVWQHHNYGLLIDGSLNPVELAELQLNGQPRQSKRSGTWYDTVEPFLRHTRTPGSGINVMSFANNPEEHQPSGTCNFSRIDTAMLHVWFVKFGANSMADIFLSPENRVLIFGTNYNVLRIMAGMCGMTYAN